MGECRYATITSPWGRLGFEIDTGGLRRVLFDAPAGPPLSGVWAEALAGYLAGQPAPDDLPVDLAGVPAFTQRVLTACREIPFGSVVTYGELARRIGVPGAARAVGAALGRNPVPIIIPCHRVIGADGRLTGFLGGLSVKLSLLKHEGIEPEALRK